MSDSELDAELLALEGDESSAEEDNVPQSLPRQETSESKKSGEKSPPRRGVAQKLKSRGRARRARRDESEEEECAPHLPTLALPNSRSASLHLTVPSAILRKNLLPLPPVSLLDLATSWRTKHLSTLSRASSDPRLIARKSWP